MVRLEDTGRTAAWSFRDMRHWDYAYASTSYSAQGATADRVLVNMDTSAKGAKALLTQAMAYVALSRPRHDMRVYTDNRLRLERLLDNSEVKRMALAAEEIGVYVAKGA